VALDNRAIIGPNGVGKSFAFGNAVESARLPTVRMEAFSSPPAEIPSAMRSIDHE